MPIERIGRFLETEDFGITPTLYLESDLLDDGVAEVLKRNLKGVAGSPVFGFREKTLDFLPAMPHVEQVWFWDVDLKDISGLYALKGLRYFGVHQKRPPINFSYFRDLEVAVWTPRRKDCGWEQLPSLREMYLWRYKDQWKSYRNLLLPPTLEILQINFSNPTDLAGFPKLPNLRELELDYCRNLTSIDGIGNFAPNLEKLVVSRCPNLVHYESARDLGLNHLYIDIKGKRVA